MNIDFGQQLRGKRALIGTLVTLADPQAAEVLAESGFDWLFVDGEHAPLGISEIQGILQAVDHRTPCAVRVPANQETYIKQALDSGAHGVIVPHVNSLEMAQKAVRHAKYSPLGERSVGIARAHGFGMRFREYVAAANSNTVLIIQIEHKDGVDNLDAILGVQGVDAVFIGPYDLSMSMGKAGQISDPEVKGCIERVRDACLTKKVPVGIFTMNAGAVNSLADEGYSLIAVSTDTVMLGKSAENILNQARD